MRQPVELGEALLVRLLAQQAEALLHCGGSALLAGVEARALDRHVADPAIDGRAGEVEALGDLVDREAAVGPHLAGPVSEVIGVRHGNIRSQTPRTEPLPSPNRLPADGRCQTYSRSALRPLPGRPRRRDRAALRRDRRRKQREGLVERSAHNVVELDLPRDRRRLRPLRARGRAAGGWKEDGVLVQDDERTIWALEQDYTDPDGSSRTRRGFLARIGVTEYGPGLVRPHERTQPGPKEDRLRLTRATKHNLSPIFVLHAGDAWSLISPRPRRRAVLRDHRRRRHRAPRLADRRPRGPRGGSPSSSATRELLIADGHHRYETARTYARRDRRRGRPPATRSPAWSRSTTRASASSRPTASSTTSATRSGRRSATAVLDLFDLEPVEEEDLVPDRGYATSPSATWTPTTASPTGCA